MKGKYHRIRHVLLIALFTFGMNAQASLQTPEPGKEYLSLGKTVAEAPPVLEYFSFYCPACYRYEHDMKISARVKAELPKGSRLTQYHARSMGPLGEELTRAWSVAILMNIEDRMKPLLFDAVQKKQTVRSWTDIRQVFTGAGVPGAEFDAVWESFAVVSLTQKQNELAREIELAGIPAMFINGKYRINPGGLDMTNTTTFVRDFADTVRYLLIKDTPDD